jgi:hypothetical protein
LQGAVKERFFRSYMSERQPIGDREVLVRLAAEAGLDSEEVRACSRATGSPPRCARRKRWLGGRAAPGAGAGVGTLGCRERDGGPKARAACGPDGCS